MPAISALRDLYAAGALPPNLSILTPADLQNLLSQGLIVMGIFGDNYYARFNDPEQSRVAGNTWFAPVPASESNTKADYASAAGVWAMTIPKNGDPESRQRAYDFMAYLSEQDNQLTLALHTPATCSPRGYRHETAFVFDRLGHADERVRNAGFRCGQDRVEGVYGYR